MAFRSSTMIYAVCIAAALLAGTTIVTAQVRSDFPAAKQADSAPRPDFPGAKQADPIMRPDLPAAKQSEPAPRSDFPAAKQGDAATK